MTTTAIDAATSMAPDSTVIYVSELVPHPSNKGKSTVEITLAQTPLPDGVQYRFARLQPPHAYTPRDIEVMRLIMEASLNSAPTGFDASDDGFTLCVSFQSGTSDDVLFEAADKLRKRVNEIGASNDTKYRINPTTRLLEPRRS